jgi:ribosomal-protein-alanine N-acetyltransferase
MGLPTARALLHPRLREAEMGDIPQILEIERRAFQNPWSVESFLRELSLPFSRTIVSIERNTEKITGYLCRWLVADECHVLNIAVQPERQRQGIGIALMADAISEARARKAALVTLEVRRSNLAARALYRRLHFLDRRVRKNYYGAGEDAIVMELQLAP